MISLKKGNSVLSSNIKSLFHTIKKNSHALGVSSAIIDKPHNRILLMKREKEPFMHKWCFPGGKVQQGETYLDATIREVKEETGVDIKIPKFHLLKIVYVGEYLLICSVSEYSSKSEELNFSKSFTHQEFQCRWFDYHEALELDDSNYVHGIRDLIPKSFQLLDFNYIKKL